MFSYLLVTFLFSCLTAWSLLTESRGIMKTKELNTDQVELWRRIRVGSFEEV